MIVVDSNVLAYFYLPTEFSQEADALRSREPNWAAPLLWRSEFRNILAGNLQRGAVTFEQACRIQREAEELLAESEFAVESRSVLELVRDSDCSAYDCEFVALAIGLDTKLVTMDARLIRAFPQRAVSLTAN